MESDHSLFDLLVLSLGNAALISLGFVPEPGSNVAKKNLESARYNIELIEMLKDKTKGNLSASELHLLSQLLYDLQLKYVEASKSS
jgi:hypothetical protein